MPADGTDYFVVYGKHSDWEGNKKKNTNWSINAFNERKIKKKSYFIWTS